MNKQFKLFIQYIFIKGGIYLFTIITSHDKRLKRPIFNPAKLKLIEKNGLKFCILNIKKPDKTSWCKLERILGDTKTRAVLHSSVSLPFDTSVKAVDVSAYSHKLTVNALADILEYNRNIISSKTATLIDISCKHQNYADILVQYFSKLRIITNKTSLYRHYKDAKLYECGAAISISNRLTRQSEENIIFVSPDGIILPGMNNQLIPIITSAPISSDVTAPVYHSFRAKTPPQYLDVITQNMYLKDYDDKTDNSAEFKSHLFFLHCYQAALYEYSGIRTLGISKPSLCILNNEVKTIEEIKVNIFTIDKN